MAVFKPCVCGKPIRAPLTNGFVRCYSCLAWIEVPPGATLEALAKPEVPNEKREVDSREPG